LPDLLAFISHSWSVERFD